jgi:hypothetical protein
MRRESPPVSRFSGLASSPPSLAVLQFGIWADPAEEIALPEPAAMWPIGVKGDSPLKSFPLFPLALDRQRGDRSEGYRLVL